MSDMFQSGKVQEILEDAWLNVDFTKHTLIKPVDLVFCEDPDEMYLRLAWLFTRPEYLAATCKYIMNVDLLPFQAAIISELWQRKFPMLIGSRGCGKSWLLSVYAMLRALLMPKRKVVIVGAAFRQSKVLYDYCDVLWKNAPIMRDLCDSDSGLFKETDMCKVIMNGNRITMLPLGSGEKIRGQRATEIIADEFACLEYDSLVETNSGFLRIQDQAAFDTLLPTGDIETPFEYPSKLIKTPLTDVYEIKFRNGYIIRCSAIHQLMTNEGWKDTLSLRVGDFVQESPSDNGFAFGDYLKDDKLAWLMGILVSEGSVNDNKRIGVTTTSIITRDKLVNEYGFKFNVREAYIDDRGWNCQESYVLYKDDVDLRTKLYDLGLEYVTAHDKKIPFSILQSSREIIRHFLSGLFDGDGSCFLWQDRDIENKIGLAYYSVSHRLCRDVQILMKKLGYDGYVSSRESKISDNPQWFVRWNNNIAKDAAMWMDVPRFQDTINRCVVTEEDAHICFDSSRNRWKISYVRLGKTIQKRFVTRKDAEDFISHLDSLTKYRQIVSIVKLEQKQNLYDYFLPETHSFFAEGFRQHNSIPRDIFENVIAGFGVVSSTPTDNVKKLATLKKASEMKITLKASDYELPMENQIVLSGTAYYDFNHFADYWKKWCKIIRSKGDHNRLKEVFNGEIPKDFKWQDYSVIRLPYNLLPEGVMDGGQISRSKATIHTGIFDMEFGAKFSKDSNGFFKRSLIEYCVPKFDNPIISKSGEAISFSPMMYGDRNKYYVIGVDPASEVDKFSISVIELNADHRRIVHQWTTDRKTFLEKRKQGKTSEDDFYWYAARKIRSLMEVFPCRHIAMDSQGGGIPISEALHNVKNLRDGEVPIWPIIDPLKEKPTDGESGLHILEMCNFSDSKWLSEANHGLRFDFEQRSLIFPTFDPLVIGFAAEDDMATGRQTDTLEELIFEIEELKNELSIIEITQTAAGRDKWDTPEVKTGVGKKGRLRKDRYSSLVMANMAGRQIQNKRVQDPYESYGGFSSTITKPDDSGKMFIGPAWFTEKMGDVY